MTKTKVPELNGGRKVTEFYLDSGELVYVEPISIYVRRAIRDKAEKLFPYPDKTLYEKAVDPERAVFADEVIPADQNPEYQKACRVVDRERSEWQTDQIIAIAARFPMGQDELIHKYADELAGMDGLIDLPEDPWEATLKFGIIRSEQDRINIIQAANSNLVLTEAEVRDGLRIFRPLLRVNGTAGTNGQERARGAAQEEPLSAEHDV